MLFINIVMAQLVSQIQDSFIDFFKDYMEGSYAEWKSVNQDYGWYNWVVLLG